MQIETVQETDGAAALRMLQEGKYRVWTIEEVENSSWSRVEKGILYFIGEDNTRPNIPYVKSIEIDLNYDNLLKKLKLLKKERMVIGFSKIDIVRRYGLDYLGYSWGRFFPPKHLLWLKKDLDSMSGSRGATMPWHKKLSSSRNDRLHWIALLEINGALCYEPTGLHIY